METVKRVINNYDSNYYDITPSKLTDPKKQREIDKQNILEALFPANTDEAVREYQEGDKVNVGTIGHIDHGKPDEADKLFDETLADVAKESRDEAEISYSHDGTCIFRDIDGTKRAMPFDKIIAILNDRDELLSVTDEAEVKDE